MNLRLLLKNSLLPLLLLLTLSACAHTETPQSLAAKTLLTSRQAVIAGATTVDALCKQGVVKPIDCATASTLYKQSQSAYNVASDAFVLAIQTGASADWAQYLTKEADYKALAASAIAAYNQFGGGK